MAVATKKREFTAEEKAAWKQEQQDKQKKMLERALAELTSSEAWSNWIKFGRPNLKRLSFNNALLIWSQRKDATVVWGKKQWEKKGVNVLSGAKKIYYLAPMFYKMRDDNGNEMYGADGKPMQRVWFRTVFGYDVSDTDAPQSDIRIMVDIEGDEHMDKLPALESFSRELGVFIKYHEDTGNALGWYDEKNGEIIVKKGLSGNALIRVLVHELAHAYGNVNYTDYSREEAEVIVESATVMALGMLDFDVSEASVPYIASWGGDLKVLDKFAKLVDELVNKLTEKMGL